MKIITALITTMSIFLLPIKGLLLTMIIFIVADTTWAIYATIKLKGIKSFTSTKFFNIVVKGFFYLGTIIMAFFIDLNIFDGSVMGIPLCLSKAMTCVWLYNEVKSCDETSMKLGNRSIWVIIKELIEKLKSLKKDLNDIKE
jgi:phage-related holin